MNALPAGPPGLFKTISTPPHFYDTSSPPSHFYLKLHSPTSFSFMTDCIDSLSLKDAEISVESEKQRTTAALGELNLTKQQIEKRLAEKDDELEAVKYVDQ